MTEKILSYILFTYLLIATVCSGVFGFLYYKLKKDGCNQVGTNTIYLTNYVDKKIPIYVNVPIDTPIPNDDGSLSILLTPQEYSNLLLVRNDYSNYTFTKIGAFISNDYLFLDHYKVSNIIKLPNISKVKLNLIHAGFTTSSRVNLGYGRKLFNVREFDLGLNADIRIPIQVFTNNYEASINLFMEF